MTSKTFTEIEAAVKDAMKAHDCLKRDCLRAVISEIKNQSINAGKELTDALCIKVLQKSAKMHNDSIEQFSKAGRDDLCSKEKAELGIISSFLPKMLSMDELASIVSSQIQNTVKLTGHAMAKKDIGIVMKNLANHPDASRIDMKEASKILASMVH